MLDQYLILISNTATMSYYMVDLVSPAPVLMLNQCLSENTPVECRVVGDMMVMSDFEHQFLLDLVA